VHALSPVLPPVPQFRIRSGILSAFVVWSSAHGNMEKRSTFNPEQLSIVTHAVGIAEELVSNYYKMSASQWLRPKYDVKTLVDLTPPEIVDGPFAQIIRYQGQPKEASLSSSTYDFYKICLQDHAILSALRQKPPACRCWLSHCTSLPTN